MTERIPVLSELLRPVCRRLRDERGFGIIEVCVSALLLAVISVGLFAGIDAASRSTAQERHRTQADGVAQTDQTRMRGMPISQLAHLDQTRTVTQDGSTYTVVSHASFVSDNTGATSDCTASGTADYIAMTSTVTWSSIGSRPPIVEQGQLTPPGAATGSGRGALAVQVSNSRVPPGGVPGVGITLSGAGSGSGTTSSSGCVLFTNQPAGTYTLTPSAAGYVDKDGNAPSAVTTSVINASTYSQTLMYDLPGSIGVSFTAKLNGAAVSGVKADTIQVYNSGMTTPRSYGTLNSPQSTLTASSLFPFTSPDSVYAGSCSGDDPSQLSPVGPAGTVGSALVPQGGTTTATVQLAALQMNAYKGANTSTAVANGAHVKLTDDNHAGGATCAGTRTFTADSTGTMITGLPYGTYDVCVDGPNTASPAVTKHVTWSNLAVTDMTNGTKITALMSAASGSPSATPASGACP